MSAYLYMIKHATEVKELTDRGYEHDYNVSYYNKVFNTVKHMAKAYSDNFGPQRLMNHVINE